MASVIIAAWPTTATGETAMGKPTTTAAIPSRTTMSTDNGAGTVATLGMVRATTATLHTERATLGNATPPGSAMVSAIIAAWLGTWTGATASARHTMTADTSLPELTG